MNCGKCRYFDNGVCRVPLYVEGERYEGRLVLPEESCAMAEERTDAVPD